MTRSTPHAPPSSTSLRVLFVDTETTGLDAAVDRVVEVATVEAVGEHEVGCWSTLVRLQRPLPSAVVTLTGLTDAMLAGGVDEAVALATLAAQMARVDIVFAWNVEFDRAFIVAAARRCDVALPSVRWACALEATRDARPDLRGYRLSGVARDLGIPTGRSHRALDDARCAWAIWRSLPSPSSAPSSPEPSSPEPSSPEPSSQEPPSPSSPSPSSPEPSSTDDEPRASRSVLALFR